jgi:hypothetical protein
MRYVRLSLFSLNSQTSSESIHSAPLPAPLRTLRRRDALLHVLPHSRIGNHVGRLAKSLPDPIRTHRLFCHAACRNSRASVAPGRRVLLLPLVPSSKPVNRAATAGRASRFAGQNARLSLRSTSSDSIPRRLRLRARAPLFGVPLSLPTRALRLTSSCFFDRSLSDLWRPPGVCITKIMYFAPASRGT